MSIFVAHENSLIGEQNSRKMKKNGYHLLLWQARSFRCYVDFFSIFSIN